MRIKNQFAVYDQGRKKWQHNIVSEKILKNYYQDNCKFIQMLFSHQIYKHMSILHSNEDYANQDVAQYKVNNAQGTIDYLALNNNLSEETENSLNKQKNRMN